MLYFAYGSMVNPVSVKRRALRPRNSLPARLDGYALRFNAYAGMANLVRAEGSSVHGVVHELDADDFEKLSWVEQGYDPEAVCAVPYDRDGGDLSPVTASTFVFPETHVNQKPTLPSSRYLSIIREGLRYHGVRADWIESIERTPCRPARGQEQFLTFAKASGASLPSMGVAELEQHKGRIPSVFAIGEKVIEADPSANRDAKNVAVLVNMMSGTDVTLFICSAIYEPSIPEINHAEDIGDLHRAWVEDFLVEEFEESRFAARQIAWLRR